MAWAWWHWACHNIGHDMSMVLNTKKSIFRSQQSLQFHFGFILILYYKMRQILLQKASGFLLQNVTKVYYTLLCQFCYKMQQLLQIVSVHWNNSWNFLDRMLCINGVIWEIWGNLANVYLFKVINGNFRAMCEICSKLTIKISEQRQWRHDCVFIVNLKYISHLFLVFLLLTLSR